MKKRTATILTILEGSVLAGEPEIFALRNEVRSLEKVMQTKQTRKTILQSFHAARVLDTALATLCRARQLDPNGEVYFWSLRSSLLRLANHNVTGVGNLAQRAVSNYTMKIVEPRNALMHRAGHEPTVAQANKLLCEMEACLQDALRL